MMAKIDLTLEKVFSHYCDRFETPKKSSKEVGKVSKMKKRKIQSKFSWFFINLFSLNQFSERFLIMFNDIKVVRGCL